MLVYSIGINPTIWLRYTSACSTCLKSWEMWSFFLKIKHKVLLAMPKACEGALVSKWKFLSRLWQWFDYFQPVKGVANQFLMVEGWFGHSFNFILFGPNYQGPFGPSYQKTHTMSYPSKGPKTSNTLQAWIATRDQCKVQWPWLSTCCAMTKNLGTPSSARHKVPDPHHATSHNLQEIPNEGYVIVTTINK